MEERKTNGKQLRGPRPRVIVIDRWIVRDAAAVYYAFAIALASDAFAGWLGRWDWSLGGGHMSRERRYRG